MSDYLIDINVKTKNSETKVAISALGTIGAITATLVGTALIAHLHK